MKLKEILEILAIYSITSICSISVVLYFVIVYPENASFAIPIWQVALFVIALGLGFGTAGTIVHVLLDYIWRKLTHEDT